MRTLFTSEDSKNYIAQLFADNTESILLTDIDTGKQTETDIAEYLNIKFYAWKNRVISKGENPYEQTEYMDFDTWVESLNLSLNEAYALVELLDEEVVASQDIDYASKKGRVTFLIQANKIELLDYYVAKIKNNLLGKPVETTNVYGEKLKMFTALGILSYEQEPTVTQMGEVILASFNFTLAYLNNALAFSDTKVELSLDGDDEYPDGKIPSNTVYFEIPLTRMSWQNIMTSQPLPTVDRPDLTGFCVSAISTVKTLTFFDFDNQYSLAFNDLFWKTTARVIDGVVQTKKDVNIPVWVRITSNGHFYVYKDIIDKMEKIFVNNDFTISSITLKGWGKNAQPDI